MMELPIFIGYDSREDIAYRVARRSIERHARNPVYIQPIQQDYMRSVGLYLHQFKWCADDQIGELPMTFNYLEGWHTKADEPDPMCVHMTRGGPWFPGYQDVEYAEEWKAYT